MSAARSQREGLRATRIRGLLRKAPFRSFWIVNLISNLGTSAFVLALNWLTVRHYGAFGIAALTLAYAVPQFGLQLVGGSASDLLDRRRLFLLTETGFLLVSLLPLLAAIRGIVPLWQLVLVNVLYGTISAFDTPARTALISQMVPPGDVLVAQQFYSVSTNATYVFGPALGGVLLSLGSDDHSHEEFAFLFNALSFLPVIFSVLWLPVKRIPRRDPPVIDLLGNLREGLGYVRRRADLRSWLLLLTVVMVLGMPVQTLLPVFVHRHLLMAEGHGFYAALLSAFGLGAFFGSLFGLLTGRYKAPGRLLFATSVGLGASILLLIESDVIHWASLAAFLCGFCGTLTVTLDNAIILEHAPLAMQGRVAAIANQTKGLEALSASIAGLIIHRLGYFDVQLTMVLMLFVGVLALRPWLLGIHIERR